MLLDLYSGTGTIALSLAHHFRRVVGAEGEEGSVEDARANAAHNNISNARFLAADLATPEGVASVAAAVPRPDAVVAGALIDRYPSEGEDGMRPVYWQAPCFRQGILHCGAPLRRGDTVPLPLEDALLKIEGSVGRTPSCAGALPAPL